MATVIFSLPSVMTAGCLDAFPERGRVLSSRIFFVFNSNIAGLAVSFCSVVIRGEALGLKISYSMLGFLCTLELLL